MREKKRFENTPDDRLASGVESGTQVLMNHVRRGRSRRIETDDWPFRTNHLLAMKRSPHELTQGIYEVIQRRSARKRIEKMVEKTMYNLSFQGLCCLLRYHMGMEFKGRV